MNRFFRRSIEAEAVTDRPGGVTTNRKLWVLYLLMGGLGLGLYARPLLARQSGMLLVAYGLSAVTVSFLGIRLNRPDPLLGWRLLALGQGLDMTGDLIATLLLPLIGADTSGWLSMCFYLAAMGCYLLGMAVLLYRYSAVMNKDTLINGCILAAGILVMIWLFQFKPSLSTTARLFIWQRDLLFPLEIAVIVGGASVYLMSPLGRVPAFRLLFLSVVLHVVGLAFYTEANLAAGFLFLPQDTLTQGIYYAIYSAAYLTLAATMLHPSVSSFYQKSREKRGPMTGADLRILALAFLALPFSSLVQYFLGHPVDPLLMIGAVTVIFLLILWRLSSLIELLHQQQELLTRQANSDALTGLPNRAFLFAHLPDVLNRAQPGGPPLAVFMIDLDHFKEVNDTFGHDQGDRVLREISRKFDQFKPAGSLIARLGGDEFVLVAEKVRDLPEAVRLAKRIRAEVFFAVGGGVEPDRTGAVENARVLVTVSIGIALFPADGQEINGLLKKADQALYRAKREGLEIFPG